MTHSTTPGDMKQIDQMNGRKLHSELNRMIRIMRLTPIDDPQYRALVEKIWDLRQQIRKRDEFIRKTLTQN